MSDQPHPDTRIIDPKSEEPGFFLRPQVIKNILRGFYLICAVLFALDFVVHRHTYVSFEGFWGFYGIFGFVACVAVVLGAIVLRKWVWRDRAYYDEKDDQS